MQINGVSVKKAKRIFLGLAVLFFAALGLSTCKQIDLFPEYRGTNLLDDISFTSWVPDQTTPYMNYEQVSGTGYEPPIDHPSAEVYRLEIKNLIPNGDFEASTVLAAPAATAAPAGWTLVNGGGNPDTLEVIDSGNLGINGGVAGGLIDNKTVHFAMDNAADRVDFDLRDAANGTVDGFLKNASYLARFNYRTDGALIFEFNDTVISLDWWKFFGGENGGKTNIKLANLLEFPPGELKGSFPETTVGDAADYYSTFGSLVTANSGPQKGYIDNVRLIRTDLMYKLRITLSYMDDTTEPLISGYYRFSVYVKSDPDAGSNNRFASDRVCIGITGGGVSSGGTGFDESSFSSYAQYYDGQDGEDFSNWSEISVDLALQVPNSSSRVMELSICPTDDSQGTLAMNAGSILISSPRLEMFPDGFP